MLSSLDRELVEVVDEGKQTITAARPAVIVPFVVLVSQYVGQDWT